MRQTSGKRRSHGEKVVKDIRRATRRQYSAEEKIRIVLDGLKGEDTIAELCRREGISQGVYYKWSKDFLEAGKRRLAGDTARAATTDESTPPDMATTTRVSDGGFANPSELSLGSASRAMRISDQKSTRI